MSILGQPYILGFQPQRLSNRKVELDSGRALANDQRPSLLYPSQKKQDTRTHSRLLHRAMQVEMEERSLMKE